MQTVDKILDKETSQRIQSVLSRYKGTLFPKLISVTSGEDKDTLNFEYAAGEHPSDLQDLQNIYFKLGMEHRLNSIPDQKCDDEELRQLGGFITICHGDVHLKNMVKITEGYKLIDLETVKIGLNYDDLDYLNLLSLFDPKKFDWLIADTGLLESYLKGAEINLSNEEIANLRRLLTIRFTKVFIANGLKNGIDVEDEQSILAKIS